MAHDNPSLTFDFGDEEKRRVVMQREMRRDPEIVRYAYTFSQKCGIQQTVFLLRLMYQMTFDFHTGA